MPEEQPLVPSPRARRLIRRALLLLNLLVTVALLAVGFVVLLPRIGPALWFWAAWIILIAGSNLGTLLRDPDYPFSILHRSPTAAAPDRAAPNPGSVPHATASASTAGAMGYARHARAEAHQEQRFPVAGKRCSDDLALAAAATQYTVLATAQ